MLRRVRKRLVVGLILAAVPARADLGEAALHFPPVAELLGEADLPGLPTREAAELRDAPASVPTFKSELRALASGRSGRQRAALERLGRRGNLKAVPYVGALLLQVNAPLKSRVAAAGALGRIGDPESALTLARAAADDAKELRFAAALALGKLQTVEAVATLGGLLRDDPHWWVRYAAAVALGDSRQPAAVPALSRALSEELRWQVRQQAARSLGQIGTRTAVEALGRALSDSDDTVRYSAARALGEVGGTQSLELLHDAYAAERDPLPAGQLQASLRAASHR